MSTVRQTGVSSPYGQTIHDLAAQTAIGSTPNKAVVSPELSLGFDDTIDQTAGAAGSAVTVLETSPYSDKIRDLLQQGDFAAILALIQDPGTRLGQLDLSVDELTKIAEGLGQGSWSQSLPLVGTYSDNDRAVVLSLIQSSQLSASDRIQALETLSGDDAVLSYLRSSPASEFSSLTTADRMKLVSLISSGTSFVDDVSGAAKELVQRRVAGQTHQVNDRLASKILMSSHNDSERLLLLDEINQFNRDDVAYRYVMDLGPKELESLSDTMKIELLKRLIDTSVSVAGIHFDLDNLANLDEALNMVSDVHASAAARLVESLKPEARATVEVQNLIGKSDQLMQRLGEIEQSLKQEMASGQLNRQKVNDYSQQLKTIQAQYANNPELASKVQALEQVLEQAKNQMDRTQQSGQLAVGAVQDLDQALEQATQNLNSSRAELKTFADNLSRSDTQLKALESQIITQYETFQQHFSQVENAGAEYAQLVAEMKGLLENGQAARTKLPQLDRLTKKLNTLAQNITTETDTQHVLSQQLDQNAKALDSLRTVYDQAVNNFNIDRSALEVKKQHLSSALQIYSQELNKLDNKQQEAQSLLHEIDADGIAPADFQPMQAALDEVSQAADKHRATRNRIQSEFESTLIPQSVRLLEEESELSSQWQAFSTQLSEAESDQERVEMMRAAAVEAVERVGKLVESLLGDVSRFTDTIKQRLSEASPEELQAILGEVNHKMSALQHAGVPIEQLQAGLQELESLRALVGELVGHIGDVSTVQKGLHSEISQVNAQRENLNVQLNQAAQRVDSASQKLQEAKAVLNQTRLNLKQLNLGLDTYQQDVDALQQQLNAIDQESQTAKKDFMTALKENPKEAKKNGVAEQFKARLQQVEAKRAEIKAKLSEANNSVAAVSSRLEYEQQELNRQEKTVQAQLASLSQAQQALSHHTEDLVGLEDQSQRLLVKADAKLAEYKGTSPDNQALKDQLSALQDSRDALVSSSQQSHILIDKANQESTKTLTALHQGRQQVTEIQTLRSDLSLAQQELPQVNADMATIEARFASIDAKRADVLHQAQQLMSDLKSGDHVLSLEEVKARGAELMLNIEHAETFEALTQMIMPVIQDTRRMVASSRQATQNFDQQAAVVQDLVNQAEGLFSNTDQIADAIALMQEEKNTAQDGLLGIQRQLLEQRRGLGIQTGDYQQLLSQYSDLLSQGDSLSLEQVAELQHLNQQLSLREADLVGVRGDLAQQIADLDHVKAQINQQVGVLHNKIQQLSALREQLLARKPELESAREDLLVHHETMLNQRQLLESAIHKLTSNFGNVAEAQAQIAELQALLDQLNQGISSVEQRLSQTDSILGLIDTTIINLDSELEIARLQLSQLELLSGQLQQLLEDANGLLGELDVLLGQVQEIKAEVQAAVDALSAEQPGSTEGHANHDQTQSADRDAQDFRDTRVQQQKLGFSGKLTNQLTNFWSGLRRQEAAEHEKNHQEQREAFQEVLTQRLALSQQYQQDLDSSIQQQELLEQITAHLVREAHQGEGKSSSINIVNVTGS